MHTTQESRSAGELHYTRCIETAPKDAKLHLRLDDAPPGVIKDGHQNIVVRKTSSLILPYPLLSCSSHVLQLLLIYFLNWKHKLLLLPKPS